MAREIVKEDIAKVKELLSNVLGTDEYTDLARMGGLTNHTYKVTMANGEIYVVRIPGEGTEELIVRSDEMISTKLACKLGVDAEMLYFGENGSKVTRYISNAVTMSSEFLKDPHRITQMAEIFKKMHSCGEDTKVPFEVFEMAMGYEKIIEDNSVPMFDDYKEIKAEVMNIKAEIDAAIDAKKVPCHNDPLCENWVVGDDRMYLIDWEYAGMNDGMWDVADVSIEAGFDKECDHMLLCAYLEREPTVTDEKHFLASKIYVDFLWTLWAKTRVPYDGQPMEDWAVERYTRLKSFINEYKAL
ncbi:MAG: phosphotransferase family protein [Clostridia bacterium]|nr:phosphotransferase family protein [Clostridia bacterium]